MDMQKETIQAGLRLIMYHRVLPGHQAHFMRWVEEHFCPAVGKFQHDSTPNIKVLASSVPNQDGSYTFVIMMEPADESIDYSIPSLLKRAYGQLTGEQYTREWESILATDHVDSILVERI
jgi:hypothetical protein